ncbi:MAG: glycosyltransferase [Vicinamibacterales bacterium]
MSDVRVLQVVLGLNPGGTERLVIELATRLHARTPTAICCLDDEGAWAAEVEGKGIRVHALHRPPGFHPSIGRAVAGVARHHRATVIHAHHYSPFVYSACTRLAGLRTPIVFTEHGRLSDAGPSGKRRLANWFLRQTAARSFGVSNDVRLHVVAEGFAPEAVGVIYNGIDVGPVPPPEQRAEVRQSLGVSDDTLVLATVARLDPVKDLGVLLDAVHATPDVPMLLLVIGDGAERPALEARAAALGLGPRVRFLGHRNDARRWLAGCDVYVNTSVSEGVSLTILEGMAACLPVLATAVGGTPEVVDDSCGLLVPARDAAACAAALRRLAADRPARERMGAAGRERVETRFTLDRMVSDYAAVYEELGAG